MTVDPAEEYGRIAESRELHQALTGRRDFAVNSAAACIARAVAAQVLEWVDAIVTVDPLYADSVAADLIEAAYFGRRL
jgi:hypothetical protein